MPYSLPEFLAHALAMEAEAAERYLELADMMEAHANVEVSSIFRDMNRYSQMHHDSIAERAGSLELPVLRHGDYRWASPPEVGDDDAFDYNLVAVPALEYARDNELRAMEYYRTVAEQTDDAEVKRLAREFAEEEREHAAALEAWLDRTPRL